MSTSLLQELDETQRVIDNWYQQSSANLQASYSTFTSQLRQLEERLACDTIPRHTPLHHSNALADSLMTPDRPIHTDERGTPAMASPPLNHGPLNYESILDEVARVSAPKKMGAEMESEMRRRPEASGVRADCSPPEDRNAPCLVLVEFKRNRIVQYESPCYVPPGEHVVVGGDRGEDIGLVTHAIPADEAKRLVDKPWTEGTGTVVRIATALEITQLRGVQTELENRAVEVAQEKVQEHALPMRIVDAEYQFDRRKLTFYYQSQHRLDFRNLVRDLYKTFRARIWMEPDVAA